MSFRGDEEHEDGEFVTRINGGRSHPHRLFTDNLQTTPTDDSPQIPPTDDPRTNSKLTNHIIPHHYLRNRIRT